MSVYLYLSYYLLLFVCSRFGQTHPRLRRANMSSSSPHSQGVPCGSGACRQLRRQRRFCGDVDEDGYVGDENRDVGGGNVSVGDEKDKYHNNIYKILSQF